MTALKIPALWASNANYATGPDAGTPTKVDPSSNADGFVRGTGAAAQHVNFLENKNTAALRRLLATQLLALRYIPIETGATLTDTAESMAAVSVSEGARTLLIKTAQSFLTSDQARLNLTGVPASITSLVTDAANSGTRVLVVGTGGNRCSYSDDGGGSWSAGANIGVAPAGLVWNSVHSRFIVMGTAQLKYSADGAAAWTASAGTPPSTASGLAMLASGNVLCVKAGTLTPTDFVVSSDGGANTSATGGSVPNAADFDDNGNVGATGGSTYYHVGRKLSGTKLQVSLSPDGIAWAQAAEISAPTGCTFSARVRVLMCPQTGLLVIAAPVTASFSTSQLALYASVDGSEWLGPVFAYPTPGTAGVALANGRLFCTRDDLFFGADGCGP